jgi:RNA polymerase sigma-70 factor (ECF subfamily)
VSQWIPQEAIERADQTPSSVPNQFEQFSQKERAEIIRKVISEMKVQRDRDILFRYYILEEEKDKICEDLGITRNQFHRIIFRAHQRYKERYLAIHNQSD